MSGRETFAEKHCRGKSHSRGGREHPNAPHTANDDNCGVTLLDKWKLSVAINADVTLTFSAKVVAFALLSHLNNLSGRCDPGYDRIARCIGSGARGSNTGRAATAMKAVKELNEAGWISVVGGGGKRKTNSYEFNFKRIGISVSFHAKTEQFDETVRRKSIASHEAANGAEFEQFGLSESARFPTHMVRKSSPNCTKSEPELLKNPKNSAPTRSAHGCGRVRVLRNSPAGRAWDRHRKSLGKSVPWSQLRGANEECWEFPTEFPPTAETIANSDR